MIKIIAIVLILTVVTGCGYYVQICEVKSTNTKLDDKSNFVYENDTLKITYTFWSRGGVLGFAIYNKLEKPIYIDWRNSSFIFNGDKINYWIDEMQTKSIGASGTYLYKENNPFLPSVITNTASSSTTTKPERITFIPPKSNYYRYQFALTDRPFHLLNIGGYNDTIYKNGNVHEMLEKIFSYDNSPLKFRNYIAYTLTENSTQLSFIDNEFYLSKVTEVDGRTKEVSNNLLDGYKMNIFFYYKLGQYNTATQDYYH